jgi:hypothetical protein
MNASRILESLVLARNAHRDTSLTSTMNSVWIPVTLWHSMQLWTAEESTSTATRTVYHACSSTITRYAQPVTLENSSSKTALAGTFVIGTTKTSDMLSMKINMETCFVSVSLTVLKEQELTGLLIHASKLKSLTSQPPTASLITGTQIL